MAAVCNFNKFGHCRFKEKCRKEHVNDVCEKKDCEIHSCSKRHPKLCRYFREYGRCKFGTFCDYLHSSSTTTEVSLKLSNLENTIQQLTNKVNKLENILEQVKEKKEIRNTMNLQKSANSQIVSFENNPMYPENTSASSAMYSPIPQLDGNNTASGAEELSTTTSSSKIFCSMSDLIDTDCWCCDIVYESIEEFSKNLDEGRQQYPESELLCKECFILLSEKFRPEDIFNCLA